MDNTSLGIVSPCSNCKNQLAVPDSTHPACPRRAQMAIYKAAVAAGEDTTAFAHLALTGKESSDSTDQSLTNPVYWDAGHSILVWVARIRDNGSALLSPDFDTTGINCSPLPYVPSDDEAQYFQNGRLEESDRISIAPMRMEQTADNNDNVSLGGTVRRTSVVYSNPRSPVNDHNAPEGL